jgi:glycosyltransferase involved in cell wall biosynthesis
MKGKISVVINTYNAERHLVQVLEAVKGFDETVVCDMESTDRTCSIAQQYGCKIVTFPKANHKSAEPARTFAIQSATNEWVLVVDADEIVTPELRDYLYQCIDDPDCPQGLYIPRRNKFFGQWVRTRSIDYQLRFFVREGTEWPPYVHTFPKVQGRVEKIPVKAKNVVLEHLEDETMAEYVTKTNLYTDNEVEKKTDRNFGVWALVWRPTWRFFKKYILDGAILEGRRGFIRAQLAAYYQFVLVAKIIEKKMRN